MSEVTWAPETRRTSAAQLCPHVSATQASAPTLAPLMLLEHLRPHCMPQSDQHPGELKHKVLRIAANLRARSRRSIPLPFRSIFANRYETIRLGRSL